MVAITEVIQQERSRWGQEQSNLSSLMMKSHEINLDISKANEMLKNYMPNRQVIICTDKTKCYFGNYPTLIDLKKKYSIKLPLIWLVGQITDLVSFSNCKNIINDAQVKELAKMINNEYGYFKLTELMLFFYLFKTGHYGDFYGTVSPIVITKSLKSFKNERAIEYEEFYKQQNERKRIMDKEGCITHEEWEKKYKSK